MVEIKKTENYKESSLYDFKIINNGQELNIIFDNNEDLCFYVYKNNCEEENQVVNFEITKANYEIYCLFDDLYNRIINCDIYKVNEVKINDLEQEEIKEKLSREFDKWNKELKTSSTYKVLVQNGVISWRHDEQIAEDANILNIHKEEDKYRLEFILKSKKISNCIDVRFRKKRSRYAPFNIPFMELYNSLQNMDTKYHQVHIEEYLFEKTYTKINNKK